MEFFRIRQDIPFMRYAIVLNAISLITFLAAVFFLAYKGLHLSIEFTGGTVLEVKYSQTTELEPILNKYPETLWNWLYGNATELNSAIQRREILIPEPLPPKKTIIDFLGDLLLFLLSGDLLFFLLRRCL